MPVRLYFLLSQEPTGEWGAFTVRGFRIAGSSGSESQKVPAELFRRIDGVPGLDCRDSIGAIDGRDSGVGFRTCVRTGGTAETNQHQRVKPADGFHARGGFLHVHGNLSIQFVRRPAIPAGAPDGALRVSGKRSGG